MTVFEIRDALGLTPLHEAEDRPVTGRGLLSDGRGHGHLRRGRDA